MLKARKQAMKMQRAVAEVRGVAELFVDECKKLAGSFIKEAEKLAQKPVNSAEKEKLLKLIQETLEKTASDKSAEINKSVPQALIREIEKLTGKRLDLTAKSNLNKIWTAGFEKIDNKIFKTSQKMLDTAQGNLNSATTTVTNRLVSGTVSALFLANDAYNLTRLCKDNHDEAKKEKKAGRKWQE